MSTSTDTLLLHAAAEAKRDKRSEACRSRLLEEPKRDSTATKDGAGEPLSPMDIIRHVHELVGLGGKVSALRKIVKPPKLAYDRTAPVAVLKETHQQHAFRPEGYMLAGIAPEDLVAAGILDELPKRRGRRKGTKK